MNNRFALIAVVGAAIGTSAIVYSAGPGEPERVIPYRGFLEQDGTPVNGPIDITFRLFDDVDTASSQLSFEEVHDDVLVSNGNFAVLLGSITTLPEAAFVAAELHLQVEVAGTTLPGLQKIFAAPQAVRTSTAQDFTVRGALTVSGGAQVDPQLSVGAGAAPSFSIEAGGQSGVAGGDNIGAANGNGYIYTHLHGNGDGSIVVPDGQSLAIRHESALGALDGDDAVFSSGGDLTLNGTVRWTCPAGTERLGARCIEEQFRDPTDFNTALNVCHAAGMDLCGTADLIFCDSINLNRPPSNIARPGSCDAATDAGAGFSVWLNDTVDVNSASPTLFAQISTYRGDNQIAFQDVDLNRAYFCCLPIVPVLVP